MARLALNKSSLKKQRDQLKTFKKFLPSLDLKRQQLQIEFRRAKAELQELDLRMTKVHDSLPALLELLGSSSMDLSGLVKVDSVRTRQVNLVGVRVPEFEGINVSVAGYSMLAKPFWVDNLVDGLRQMAELRLRRKVQEQRVAIVAEALRKVTQRVNLFEKVLIPQAKENIRKINIFLADGQRVAVVRSKIAKAKNVARHMEQD